MLVGAEKLEICLKNTVQMSASRMDQYFAQMSEIANNSKAPSQVRAMLLELVDLRKDGRLPQPGQQPNTSVWSIHKAKNPWKPSHLRADRKENDEDLTTEDIFKKTKSILNKLTPQKFQTLVSQMLALKINTESELKGVVELIHEQVVSEQKYIVAYANMCRCLTLFKVPSESKQGETVNFRAVLLTRCQREFEKPTSIKQLFAEKRQQTKKDDEYTEDELKADLEVKTAKAKRRYSGNMRFMGELFKLRMLTENIMHHCVLKLLLTKDPELLESICMLLTTIGKELETDKARPRMDQYFTQMGKIVNQKTTSARVRFMLQDVIDLRKNKWVPTRSDNNPKTIDQIHQEVAKEAQDRAFQTQQALAQQKVAQKGTGGRRGFLGVPMGPPSDDGLRTPFRAIDRYIDPTKAKISTVGESSVQFGPGGEASRFAGWGCGSTGGGASHREKLEFTKSGLQMITIEKKLQHLIVVEKRDNETVFDWIESNVDEPTTRRSKFIRALMTCVCEAALIGDGINIRVEPKEVSKRRDLLQKYLDHQAESELQALYALQAVVTKLEHPAGVLRQMFDTLYDEDIISEAAFIQWEKSDEEPDGKGVAMKQVVQFFTWLREAEDDDEDDVVSPLRLELRKGGDSVPDTQTTGLPMITIEEELQRLIVVEKGDNETVFDWIESNADEPTTRRSKFIRALMTCVCEAAIIGDGSNIRVEPKEVSKRHDLLEKYLAHQTESELQALYALQALVTKLGHPRGVLRRMFDTLYDEDIISEDAFIQWEKSDEEPDGKGVAMKQVVQFFTWLREADDNDS